MLRVYLVLGRRNRRVLAGRLALLGEKFGEAASQCSNRPGMPSKPSACEMGRQSPSVFSPEEDVGSAFKVGPKLPPTNRTRG